MTVYYFTSTMTSFKVLCTDEATIDDIVNRKCLKNSFTTPGDLDDNIMKQYRDGIQQFCLQPSHKDTLLMVTQNNRVFLFGLAESVNSTVAEHESLKQKLSMDRVDLNFQKYQVHPVQKF
jgi:hypothetical protein